MHRKETNKDMKGSFELKELASSHKFKANHQLGGAQ
jgi:hypothetical protein